MTRTTAAFLIAAAAGCAPARPPAAPPIPPPPATRVVPVTDTLHGITVTDDYRWLEGDLSDPQQPGRLTSDVTAWTVEQRRYARSVLDALPGREAITARLVDLDDTGDVTLPSVHNNRYFYSNRHRGETHVAIVVREGALGSDRELLRTSDLDPSGLARILWISPSPDGRRLAYSVYRAGDQDSTLRVMDVDSKKALPVEIFGQPHPPQWMPDGSGFVYQHLGDPTDPGSNVIRFHQIGTNPAADPVLHRQVTAQENLELSRTWGPFGTLSRDGKWFLAGYWASPTRADLWLASMDEVLRTGRIRPKVVSVGVDGRASGTVIGNTLYLSTTKGAPNGRVVAVATSDPAQSRWRDIVPERSDAQIEAVAFGRGVIAVTYLKNASNVTEVFDLAGRPQGVLAQPGIGSTTLSATEDRNEAFLTFQSFGRPPTIYRVDLASPATAPAQWKTLPVPIDSASVDVQQVRYPSKDGTEVSMFLAHRKGLALAAEAPVLLVASGALGVGMRPTFSASAFQWFEAGGVMAVPLVRGGSEFGAAWRAAGVRDRKQASIDDLIAAAEWLIAKRYTRADRIAFFGTAGGGLLGAAAITQRPDLFRAAVLLSPITDMLRYDRFLQGPLWVPEFGSPADRTEFSWLNAYSPYQRVKAGVTYPAVFIGADDRSPDVHPLHARKLAARLQAVNPNPTSRPVLLVVEEAEAASGAERVRGLVDQWVFTASQLGVTPAGRRSE